MSSRLFNPLHKLPVLFISLFRWLSHYAIRHPRLGLVLVAVVTLAAAPGILRLKLRTDGHALVSPAAPEVLADKAIRDHFGIHDQLVVLIQPGNTNGIFNPATLQLVRDLTAEFIKTSRRRSGRCYESGHRTELSDAARNIDSTEAA